MLHITPNVFPICVIAVRNHFSTQSIEKLFLAIPSFPFLTIWHHVFLSHVIFFFFSQSESPAIIFRSTHLAFG